MRRNQLSRVRESCDGNGENGEGREAAASALACAAARWCEQLTVGCTAGGNLAQQFGGGGGRYIMGQQASP